jgi:hypothetical protein
MDYGKNPEKVLCLSVKDILIKSAMRIEVIKNSDRPVYDIASKALFIPYEVFMNEASLNLDSTVL